jgi:hypothetical protein
MKLLAALCEARMPSTVLEPDDIEKLLVLKATGFVEADIPPMLLDEESYRYSAPAVVLKVTERGFAACQTHEQKA